MEAMEEWTTGLAGMNSEEAEFMNQFLPSYDQPYGGLLSTATVASYHRQNSHWTDGFSFFQESNSYNVGHSNVNSNDEMINTNLYLVGEETSECNVSTTTLLPLEMNEENHNDNMFNACLSSKKRSLATSTDKNKKARNQKSMEMNNDNNKEEHTEKAGKRKTKPVKLQKTCCSDEELNGGETSFSKEGGDDSKPLNLINGKTRANRGAATDPQSLYARKRRERINERLRILQNLVPNGTKVDISTMLDEAVQYVKFLQLQIKLLSSDDLWMYAPIAYNGMDIGLDIKLNSLL